MESNSLQNIILKLTQFWRLNGCLSLFPYDKEVGAGTLSPFTAFKVLSKEPWSVCYLQYCRRPTDYRFASNPNRVGGYYQFQALLKPAEKYADVQDLVLKSLISIGIDVAKHDIRFIEDNWQNESIGASGLGYEVWCDGMEILQFTYIQKMGGLECPDVACEITYGIERISMYIQDVDRIFDIIWSYGNNDKVVRYGDIHTELVEKQYSEYVKNFHYDDDELFSSLNGKINKIDKILEVKVNNMLIPAYEQCLDASHLLNILDARGVITANERMSYVLKIRDAVMKILSEYQKGQ